MSMKNFDGEIQTLEDTPFGYAIRIISGKWKLVIIYLLAEQKFVRFKGLRNYIGNISDNTLAKQLKELENDRIICRRNQEGSSHAEYYLTERGWTLVPIVEELCYWGVDNKDDL